MNMLVENLEWILLGYCWVLLSMGINFIGAWKTRSEKVLYLLEIILTLPFYIGMYLALAAAYYINKVRKDPNSEIPKP